MQYLIGSAKELARVWKAWGVGSERDAAAAAVHQPHRDRLRDHRLGQAADACTRRASSPRKSPTTCRCWPRSERRGDGTAAASCSLGRSWSIAAIAVAAVFGLASHAVERARRRRRCRAKRSSGRRVTLASLLAGAHGRPALVVFWASWCGPCAQEAPALERFSKSAAGRGRIVGVDWSDALSGAQRVHPPLRAGRSRTLRDAEGTVGNAYRLTGLPTTFVHRRPRAHPRGAARATERRLAAAGAGRRRRRRRGKG